MEWLSLLLKLGHVFVAFALVTGMVGRWILLTRASRTDDVRGRVFEDAMAEARAQGRVTDDLRAAWEDPAVAFARRYELAAIGVIVALMVLKPF
jgi:hypothetical protein